MLHMARMPTVKTRLMYGCYLSYSQLQKYLEYLTEKGLLRHGSKYQTTEKGFKFLEIYKQLEAML